MVRRFDRTIVREYAVLLLLVLVAAVFYAHYSLVRHARYSSAGFDLGIYDQAIWHWSRFETAVSTIRRVPNLFGDHFHPTLMLYAPLEWIGDGTKTILIVQAFVVTLAAIPIYRFARRRLDAIPSLLIVLTYLISWGVAVGLALDLHDTSWSALALALTLEAYDRRARWATIASVAFLLLSREDQSLAVALLGVLALSSGRRREGATLLFAGVAWFVLTIRFLIPLFNQGAFEHWEYKALAPDPGAFVVLTLTKPWVVLKALVFPRVKLDTMIRTVAAFGFLPLLSPYAILILPTLAATLLSDTPSRWEPFFHYWMPVSVVAAIAAADGLGRLRPRLERWSRDVPKRAGYVVIGLAVVALIFGLRLSRFVPQRELLRPTDPKDVAIARDGDRILALIPPDASVSATNNAVGHLAHRESVYLLRYSHFDAPGFPAIRASYVVVDPRAIALAGKLPGHPFDDPDYRLLRREGDWYLYGLKPALQAATGFQPQDAKDRALGGPHDLRTAEPVR